MRRWQLASLDRSAELDVEELVRTVAGHDYRYR
jgi:hypothetical protein